MTQPASSGSPSVSPSVPDSFPLYWTLVDQAVIPPGFEDIFMGFSEAWTEAAARDDHRKSSWNNESAAVTPAAQKRAQDGKVRLETHSKDAEEDEWTRWLHILAGIVQNTDTPMSRLLREKPGNILLLGAGKRATTLRARVMSLRRYTLWLSTAYGVSFPREIAHLVDFLQARSQEPTTRGGRKGAHQAMIFF